MENLAAIEAANGTIGDFYHDETNKILTVRFDGKHDQKRYPTTLAIQGIHSLAPPPVVTEEV